MKYYLTAIMLLVLIFYGATCQKNIRMSEENQKNINENLREKRFFVKYSFYYGDFYGNSDTCLLSTRRFSETVYLEGIDGKPILPGTEKGIIPFNTEVMVEKVEFPPANRPLLTPRFYPWVYIKVDKLSGYKNCIVVIRPDVDNPEEFYNLFYEIFSRSSADGYLKGLSAEARDAVFNKSFATGLGENEIIIIFGKPDSVTYMKEKESNLKVLDYNYFRIILKDGVSYKYEKAGEKN